MGYTIKEALTDEEILACGPVYQVLRPHVPENTLVERVKQQHTEGFHLRYIKEQAIVTSIMGYRIKNDLYSGKMLYVDDLCTLPTCHGKGYAGALLDWAIQYAKEQNCDCVALDSGYTRNDAHRLYLNKKFKLTAHHFRLILNN